MSKDRLGERLGKIEIPQANDAREGAVAEARAEVSARGGTAPVRGQGRRRTLVLGAAALLALVVLLTPPGRSASAWVGELVGIGEVGGEPTLRERTFGQHGTAVVIDNGTAPDGSRYEWVAYRCEVNMPEGGSSFTGIGLSFEWPGIKRREGSGGCEELEGRPRPLDHAIGSHGVHILPSQFKGVESPGLVISGQTGPEVHDVKVIYQEPDGGERELPADFARVDGELRELAHRPEAMGTFVAFLPGDVAARDEVEQRLDLRALLDTGKLKLGPIARRERELARAAIERCERFEPELAEMPKDPDDHATVERVFRPVRDCHEREMPPSPFVYVAYDEQGREVERFSEPLITALVQRPGDIEPAGREQPGDERIRWSDVNRAGRPVHIMSGRAPDGALYEVVMARPKGAGMHCMTFWWPYVEDIFAGSPCGEFPREDIYGRKEPEKVAARPDGFLTPFPQATAHYLLSGFARPSVSRVRILYEDTRGRRRDAPIKLRQVGAKLAERAGWREPSGFWVAFIPRAAGRRPMLEVIAYDESGKILSRIDYRA